MAGIEEAARQRAAGKHSSYRLTAKPIKSMKLLLRWKTAFCSSFESVLNQLENHEAVVAAAIREAREAAAGARVKQNRLRREGERMRSRIDELNDSSRAWASRALQVHGSEPEKALECVRRRNLAQREAQHLEAEMAAHREIEQQLQRDLALIDNRIAELGRRRTAFSSREFRAKALGAGESCVAATEAGSLEEVFDRWEMKLASVEPALAGSVDALEAGFAVEEERAALKAQMEELLQAQARTVS